MFSLGSKIMSSINKKKIIFSISFKVNPFWICCHKVFRMDFKLNVLIHISNGDSMLESTKTKELTKVIWSVNIVIQWFYDT